MGGKRLCNYVLSNLEGFVRVLELYNITRFYDRSCLFTDPVIYKKKSYNGYCFIVILFTRPLCRNPGP